MAAIPAHVAYAKANVPQPMLTVVSLVTFSDTEPNEKGIPLKKLISTLLFLPYRFKIIK